MWEAQPCRHQDQCRRRARRCSRHQSTDSPVAQVQTTVSQAGPCSPCSPRMEQRFTFSLWRAPTRSTTWPKEAVTLWEVHTGAGLVAGLITWLWDPRWTNCACRTACCGKGPHTRAGEDWEQSYSWRGRSARDNMWSTDAFPDPLHCWDRGERENSGVKLRPGWRGEHLVSSQGQSITRVAMKFKKILCVQMAACSMWYRQGPKCSAFLSLPLTNYKLPSWLSVTIVSCPQKLTKEWTNVNTSKPVNFTSLKKKGGVEFCIMVTT